MKLRPATKLDKKTKTTLKKLSFSQFMSNPNSRFEAIRKLDFGCIVCRTYIFINSNFLSYENLKQN